MRGGQLPFSIVAQHRAVEVKDLDEVREAEKWIAMHSQKRRLLAETAMKTPRTRGLFPYVVITTPESSLFNDIE
jgi:hypothetical protein